MANKKHFFRNRAGRYGICATGLAAVITAAFLLPQAVFAMQDSYQAGNTWREDRSGVDMADLNMAYEKSLQNRLNQFAEGLAEGRKYYQTTVEYEIDETFYETINKIIYQDILLFLIEWGVLSEYVYDSQYYIQEYDTCKKYVIYDEEFEDGIAFSAWYLDISFEDGTRLQVLADTEDSTIYFIKATSTIKRASSANWSMHELFYGLYGNTEASYAMGYYYGQYYSADSPKMDESYEQYIKNYAGETNSAVVSVDGYVEPESKYNYDIGITENAAYEKEEYIYKVEEQEGSSSITVELPYGNNTLECAVRVYQQNADGEGPFVTIGISEIGVLIPDMALG